jgi:hypothetical protein
LHRYDELLGGKLVWSRAVDPHLWRLLGVRYLITGEEINAPPGFVKISGPTADMWGEDAYVYRIPDPAPWAWVVPVAVGVPDDQAEKLLIDQRFDPTRMALVPPASPLASNQVPTQLPPPVTPAPTITVTEGAPGVYHLTISGLDTAAVLVVSENWFPSWSATVDGRSAPVSRADFTFMAVPLPAHAKDVVLTESSVADRRGRYLSYAGAGFLLVIAIAGAFRRRPTPEPVDDDA